MLDKDAIRRLLPLLTLLLLGSIAPRAHAAELAASPQHHSSQSDRAHDLARSAAYEYPIKVGDTLWDIAVAHGITLQELLAANPGLDSAALHVGQVILVPTSPPAVAEQAAKQETRPTTYEYSIKTGDTLWDIAVTHGITVQDLLAANPGLDSTTLRVGQALVVPAAPPPPAPLPPPPPQPEVVAPDAEAAPAETTTAEITPTEETPPGPDADAPQPEPAEPAAPTSEAAPELIAILDSMNAERAARGLPALVWSDALAQAAQAHAEDCARRNRGSHIGSDGARLRERLARVGLAPRNATENWANAKSPQKAFQMWFNEGPNGPHRRAILGSSYSEVGIGVARGSWGYYFIANFGGR